MTQTAQPSDKKILLKVLTLGSAKELLKHRSFIALIFIILIADKVLHHFFSAEKMQTALAPAEIIRVLPEFLFRGLPAHLAQWLFSPYTVAVLVGLFLFKQIISLWPSSSLRRWHNDNRNAGMLTSLAGLKGSQFFWDFCALAILILTFLIWSGIWFLIGLLWWSKTGSAVPAWLVLICIALALPLVMAGLSYSSKLAVLHNGSFAEKFGLYIKLFTVPHILGGSWLFFLARSVLETIFVVIVPAAAILFLDNEAMRILVICVSVPWYSYLKMASFKFFLFIYRHEQLVQLEFVDYFRSWGISVATEKKQPQP